MSQLICKGRKLRSLNGIDDFEDTISDHFILFVKTVINKMSDDGLSHMVCNGMRKIDEETIELDIEYWIGAYLNCVSVNMDRMCIEDLTLKREIDLRKEKN